MEEHGIYVLEDLETSYWSEFGGSNDELNSPLTTVGLLKSFVDGLHYHEYRKEPTTPTYFEKHITALHFYHNLVFIYKGFNNEGLSLVGERRRQGHQKDRTRLVE
jgi:demethylmacrocin O-methyltransferase